MGYIEEQVKVDRVEFSRDDAPVDVGEVNPIFFSEVMSDVE